jgi:uncharacterized membrane protein YcfT
VFFVVTKLTRRAPPLAIFVVLAALEMSHIQSGWTAIDEFAARFVYFFTGYWMARHVFAFAAWVQNQPAGAMAALAVWAAINGGLVLAGLSLAPLVSLGLGLAGACAVIGVGALLARQHWLEGLRYCGEHSIVIYLAFFLPMASMRAILLHTGLDLGLASIVITAAGVLGALVLWWAARNTRLNFLFERPAAFWLTPKPRVALQPAE